MVFNSSTAPRAMHSGLINLAGLMGRVRRAQLAWRGRLAAQLGVPTAQQVEHLTLRVDLLEGRLAATKRELAALRADEAQGSGEGVAQ